MVACMKDMLDKLDHKQYGISEFPVQYMWSEVSTVAQGWILQEERPRCDVYMLAPVVSQPG